MVKILDVGCGEKGGIIDSYLDSIENKEITRLDIDPAAKPDVLHDITKPLPEEYRGKFDLVFCSHVLEHIDRRDVIQTLRNVASGLKNLGELWIIVPSLDWLAKEILKHRDGTHVQGLLYGAQRNEWDYHRSAFTLNALRVIVEICGLMIRKAYQAPFTLMMDGKEWEAIQNIVIAARYDIPEEVAHDNAPGISVASE